jgi:hypothetical protein
MRRSIFELDLIKDYFLIQTQIRDFELQIRIPYLSVKTRSIKAN